MILFNLVDEGYDIFLGNNRFTQYSNVNSNYPKADSPTDPAYAAQTKAKYDSGWDEMGKYDVPAMLDKVMEVSPGKVNYIGYSQGTAQLFYALATNNAGMENRIEKAIMLAPCLYTNYIVINNQLVDERAARD